MGANPDTHRDQQQIDIVDDGGKGGHTVLPAQREFQHPFRVAGNGVFQLLEGRRRLVEGFDHRHTPDILHRGVVHFFQGLLILAHVLFHLAAAKTDELGHKGQDDARQRGQAKAPVHRQQDDDHDHRRCDRGHKVRELVGDKSLHALDVFIHDFAQPSAANSQVITQRYFGNVVREEQLQVVQRPEGRQVGCENSQKIQQDVGRDACQRQPAAGHHGGQVQPNQVGENAEDQADHSIHRDIWHKGSDGCQGRKDRS